MSGRGSPIVSDHALLRWLERRHGFNVDALRDEAAREIERYAGTGCKSVTVDGLQWIIDGWRATTVLPAGVKAISRGRPRD